MNPFLADFTQAVFSSPITFVGFVGPVFVMFLIIGIAILSSIRR